MTRARTSGRIAFVGAGPGDPGLLTAPRPRRAAPRPTLVLADADVPRRPIAVAGAARPRSAAAEGDAGRDRQGRCSPRPRSGASVVRLVAGDPFTDDAAVKEALAVGRTVVPVRRRARRRRRRRRRGLRRRRRSARCTPRPTCTDADAVDFDALAARARARSCCTVDAADVADGRRSSWSPAA